ncbi:MAG: response regulator [Oscillospiraceae bacterium]|jgi:two-component system response regulator YesN|nr:response regulator [Oscillospiraceae bacterium]
MRVLVVDDEKIERDGIRFLLQQTGLSCTVREAANGSEAAAMLKKELFDVLLTDIRMPFMNGLELTKTARESQEGIQIVIFSGYSDFEYAKQAIRYGVSDYVLKPVDPEEFNSTMQRVASALAERQRLLTVEKQLCRIEGSYYLRQYLVRGRAEDFDKAREYVDVSLWETCSTLFLAESEEPVFFGEPEWLSAERLQRALQCPVFVLPLQDTRAAFLLGRQLPCSWRLLAQDTQHYLEGHSGRPVWLSAAGGVQGAASLGKPFRTLSRLLGRRVTDPEEKVLYADESPVQQPREKTLLALLEPLKEDIRRGDVTGLWKHFYAARAALSGAAAFPASTAVKYVLSGLMNKLMAALPAQEREPAIGALYRARTLEETAALLQNAICCFESGCSEQAADRPDVDLVKRYIAQHYEEDLSVESLAEVVYLSPGYLSALFKRETGQNLNTYIRNYRLLEARRLLENTNMKIVQVCKKTGFTNASYFCKRFREYFGTSPRRLRSTEVSNEETAE